MHPSDYDEIRRSRCALPPKTECKHYEGKNNSKKIFAAFRRRLIAGFTLIDGTIKTQIGRFINGMISCSNPTDRIVSPDRALAR